MRIKKSVVVTLSDNEKRALGRLAARMRVGAVGSEDSPVYCSYTSCTDCPFYMEAEYIGYHCLINQIIYLKLKLSSILDQIKNGNDIEV